MKQKSIHRHRLQWFETNAQCGEPWKCSALNYANYSCFYKVTIRNNLVVLRCYSLTSCLGMTYMECTSIKCYMAHRST